MTLAQRAELSDAKILLGVKYYLAQNIYIKALNRYPKFDIIQ